MKGTVDSEAADAARAAASIPEKSGVAKPLIES
jgi:hypothetical protein